MIASWQESNDKPRQCVEKQNHSTDKGLYIQGYGLPSGHVQLWKLEHKKGIMPKNWCLRTVVLEKTPESHFDSEEIKPVSLKENQPWILNGRTDAEAEAPVLWPPDAKNRLIGKDPDSGKYTRQSGKGIDRGWDGWMTSLTQWTWVWVSSGSWWWTGRPGLLQSMGSQRVGCDWVTELNWTDDWLQHFMARAIFHNIKVSGEAVSADMVVAWEFPEPIWEIINEACTVFTQARFFF